MYITDLITLLHNRFDNLTKREAKGERSRRCLTPYMCCLSNYSSNAVASSLALTY
jgi:hypothetical protein